LYYVVNIRRQTADFFPPSAVPNYQD